MSAMKRDCIIILSIIFSAIPEDHGEKTTLRAVTNFPVLEEYYHSLLTQNPHPEQLPELSSSKQADDELVKKKLCRKIFTSTYFKRQQRKWINVDDPIALRGFYFRNSQLFYDLLPQGSTGAPKYTNPYKPYSFVYDTEYESDLMFVCPVLKKKSNEIKTYLVTREYDVNLAPNAPPIVGRFVFRIDRTNRIVIEALAEEPAVSSAVKQRFRFVVEYKYMKRRQFDLQRGAPQEVDPVCRLTPSNKLRLCASVFASKMLRFKYKFTPTLENVEPSEAGQCRKIRVSFLAQTHARALSKMSWKYIDRDRIYDEWMIGCRAIRTVGATKDQAVTYYVSRGYAKNTVFTFKEKFSDGRIFVKHYMRNVSVVDGVGAEEIGQRTIN